jgi:short-subunit dehydrogenase
VLFYSVSPGYSRRYSLFSRKAFSATHNLALLSRSSATLDKTIASLPSTAVVHPFPNTDAADESSIKKAFVEIKEKWPGMDIDVAVFNPGGSFAPGPFLEKSVDDLRKNLEGGV